MRTPMAYLEKGLSFIPFLNCWCAKVNCGGNLGVSGLSRRQGNNGHR